MNLNDIAIDAPARIAAVAGNSSLAQRLMAMGFLPGARVRVVNVAPFGDPITVELEGWRVSMRRSEAASVAVEGAE